MVVVVWRTEAALPPFSHLKTAFCVYSGYLILQIVKKCDNLKHVSVINVKNTFSQHCIFLLYAGEHRSSTHLLLILFERGSQSEES